MYKTRFLFLIFITGFLYACQPSAVRETVEPHPVTEEGLIASSLYAAERVGTDEVKSDMLRRISLMKLAQNEFDAALDFAGQIPLQNVNDRTIADIAIAINERGERDRARSIAGQIESEYEKSRVLADVAVTYERAHEFRRGRELAEEIPDPNFKARAVAGIAVIYHAEGYGDLASRLFNQALRAARTEQSLTHHIETLLYIAEKYNEAGRQQDARDVFADVRRLTENVHLEQHVVTVWSSILNSYRQAGMNESVIDDAIAIARDMDDAEGYFRDELFSRVAVALMKSEDYERSGSITGEIDDLPLRVTTYARLSVIAHNRNDTEEADELLTEALTLSETIPDGAFKQRVLRDIGKNAVEMQRYDTVDLVTGMISEPHFAAEVAVHAAGAALDAEDTDIFTRYLEQTVEAFDDVDDPVIQSGLLFDIAELYERSGYTPDEDTKLIVSRALHAVE